MEHNGTKTANGDGVIKSRIIDYSIATSLKNSGGIEGKKKDKSALIRLETLEVRLTTILKKVS